MLQIRRDIVYKRRLPTDDGTFLYTIYDGLDDSYYTLPEITYKILQLIKGQTFEELSAQCELLSITKAKLAEAILFFKENNFFTANNGLGHRNKNILKESLDVYFYKKIPLISPDSLFNYLKPAIKVLLHPITVLSVTFLAIVGYLFLFVHWSKFSSSIIRSLSISSIPYYIIALVIIKIIHELGHAFTAKLYGGRIRKMGLALIFLTPRLYTDVTDLYQMSKMERMKISSAGIFIEVLLGGFMSILFLSTSPTGLTAQVSSSMIAITMISTLLFNGNFFMKFDGYYILSDFLEIPNLYSRSKLSLKRFTRNIIWGIAYETERSLILLTYGFLGFLYRIFLYTTIVIFLWNTSLKPLAVLLCSVEIYVFFFKPFMLEVNFFMNNFSKLNKSRVVMTSLFITGVVFFGFYPITLTKSCPLYVAPKKEIQDLKSSTYGFISEVNENQIILKNSELSFSKKDILLERRYAQILSNYYHSNYLYGEYKESLVTEAQINSRLDEISKEEEDLVIPYKGKISNPKDLLGQFVSDGSSISTLISEDKIYIAAFLPAVDYASVVEGDIHFKHMKSIPARVVNKSLVPLSRVPDILTRKITSDVNKKPIDIYYEVNLEISSQIKNNNRTGLFVYKIKSRIIPDFYNSVLNFIRKELT